MSQLADADCPICQNPMGMSGEHQISALKCGHVFCKECIEKWLQIKEECPECRAPCKLEDITPIFWTKGVPVDDRELTTLKEENERLKSENEDIMNSLEAGLFAEGPKSSSGSNSFPSLVIQRKIESGSRVCFSQTRVILSTKKNNKYGIEYALLTNLSKWQFIPLHSMQVRDLCINQSPLEVCCSISYDSTIAFVSLVNPNPSIMTIKEIPWSCIWVNTDTIAIGAAKGTFFIINSRDRNIIQEVSVGGPPFFSISFLDSTHIACLNSQFIYLFDMETSSFLQNPVQNKSSIIKKSATPNDNIFALLSYKERKCTVSSATGSRLAPIKWCFIGEIKQLARPAVATRNQETYLALPGKALSISLRRLTNFDHDIWEEFKNRWFFPENTGVVMDTAFSSEGDLLLAIVYESFFALFLLPF